MREWKLSFLCAGVNLKKWRGNAAACTIAACFLAFALWNMGWVTEFCLKSGTRVTPWIFPFSFSAPTMMLFYGGVLALLFSNAPFQDRHTPFLMIRTGKQSWIRGQLVYICVASLILPLFYYGAMLLVLLPVLGFSSDWGGVLRSLAADPMLPHDYGIPNVLNSFDYRIMDAFSPLAATLWSLLLAWLVGIFIGTLILFFNIAVKPGMGIVVAAFFTFWAYFTNYVGLILYGNFSYYVSPLSWTYMGALSPFNQYAPTLPAVIAVLLGGSILLSSVSIIIFSRKDT